MGRQSASRISSPIEPAPGTRNPDLPGGQIAEALGPLIGGIAHDCNNLLSGILANAEAALLTSGGGDSTAQELEHIRDLALRASEIVRELMICAGQEDRATEPVSISSIIAEMVHLVRVLVPKNIGIETKLAKRLPPVYASAPRIRQIVLNLIINAAEAIGRNSGSIVVATRRATTRHDSLLAGGLYLPAGDYAVLEVSDTGHGMAKPTQAEAFAPFFTTKAKGTGLGLSVVREIVRQHGGVIGVESEPDNGSTFDIFLPVWRGRVRRDEASGSGTAEPERARIRVLFAEDEGTLRLAIARMLRKYGFTVVEAEDGDAAIALFRKYAESLDVVLIDLTIADTASRPALQELRRLRPSTRMVLTSAYSREVALAGLDWRPAAFLRKPYRISDLVTALRTAAAL